MTNVNRIAEIINENGIKAEPKQMHKGNFTKQSIMLGDGTIRPTVYPEDYEGTDEMIAETIVKKYMNGDFAMNNVVPNFSADAFMDWKSAKENLVLCLRPVTNVETPNITKAFLDVEMYVRYMVNNEASIVVNKEHVEKWGVQPATVFKYAKENMKGKYYLKGMSQVMAEMMGLSEDELEMMGIDKDNEQMFVGTNERKVNGASMLAAGNGYFKELCRDMHTDRAFILPSSIHEILIIPDKGEMPVDQLAEMVNEVNNTEVAPEDILSYNVYVYDLAKDKVKLA